MAYVQPNIPELKKWIEALEALDSGLYKQYTKGGLQGSDFEYCCLGVGCAVLISNELLERDEEGRLGGGFPSDQHFAPLWFKCVNDEFEFKTGKYLTDLNDSGGYSFTEIATLLELVYIHKILD